MDKVNDIRKYLYKLLCRDSEKVHTDGLDIPVYFHVGGQYQNNFPKIKDIKSDKPIIIPLLDDRMICDSFWGEYLEELNNEYNDSIFPITLSKYSFDINEKLSKKQFIKLKTFSLLDNKLEFQIRLFEILIRIISEKPNCKLRLFISHSKKDLDKTGELVAEGLRDYINSKTKLSTFFDANDILDGQSFEEVIFDNVESSLFVLVHSDTYSDREWCRKEIIKCKENGIPAIIVDFFSHQCNRVFPYMANIPSIRFKDNNWEDIINLMLRTALDWRYHENYLRSLSKKIGKDPKIVEPTVPELISIHFRHKDDDLILYPEPPLGLEELDILTKSFEKKRFVTPMQILTSDINIEGKKIAISISEPNAIENNIICSESLKDLAIEIARHLLAAKAQLVYGGDLRKNGFTEQLAELSYQYYKDQHDTTRYISFHNFFAWPIYNGVCLEDKLFFKKNRVNIINGPIPEEVKNDEKDRLVPPNNQKNKYLWSKSLTLMRQELERFADAIIAIGGRTNEFKGCLPGIIEEVSIAMQYNKPIYIIGAAGGSAQILRDCICGSITPEMAIEKYEIDSELKKILPREQFDQSYEFFKILNTKGFSLLNNGLDKEDNSTLMNSTNLTEIVALILKGLKKIF
ncbi:MAG: TIR domain-containing protein [Erysipelotrichales bacterium]|nr:TIR domain-containing protein [Erysipelotrichales bacterium]